MPRTGPDGRVLINVVPGDYIVGVVAPPGYRSAPDQEVLGLQDGETRAVNFLLEAREGTLDVTVRDSRTGSPLADVEVNVTPK